MLSLRHISRSAIRSASRLQAQPVRLGFSSLAKPSVFRQTSRIASLLPSRTFTTSLARLQTQEGQTDGELSAKIQSELQLEEEMGTNEELPDHLKDFLDNSGFAVKDTLGDEEVVLTKAFGQETIKVAFSIADLEGMDSDADEFSPETALGDEEDIEGGPASMQQGGAQTKGAINVGRTKGGNINVAPEDRIAPADREELADDEMPEEEDYEPSFPARISVTIEKPGDKGAIQFDTIAADGQIVIQSIYHFPKKEFADAQTAEQDWARRSVYTGPPYGNLDEDLQRLMESYLNERGIDTALALWVPEYVDFKEQKEYLNWLNNLKSFVDA